MTTDGQAAEVYALDHGSGEFSWAAEPDHIHRPAGGDQGLCFTTDPSVFLVVGVHDHADRRAPPGGAHAGPVLRALVIFSAAPAPSRRSPAARLTASLPESSAGARAAISRNAAPRSTPTRPAELSGPPTVSTHSVVLRRTRQGTPNQADSRCTPPESVSTAAA